jgi:hypothetical protein
MWGGGRTVEEGGWKRGGRDDGGRALAVIDSSMLSPIACETTHIDPHLSSIDVHFKINKTQTETGAAPPRRRVRPLARGAGQDLQLREDDLPQVRTPSPACLLRSMRAMGCSLMAAGLALASIMGQLISSPPLPPQRHRCYARLPPRAKNCRKKKCGHTNRKCRARRMSD